MSKLVKTDSPIAVAGTLDVVKALEGEDLAEVLSSEDLSGIKITRLHDEYIIECEEKDVEKVTRYALRQPAKNLNFPFGPDGVRSSVLAQALSKDMRCQNWYAGPRTNVNFRCTKQIYHKDGHEHPSIGEWYGEGLIK